MSGADVSGANTADTERTTGGNLQPASRQTSYRYYILKRDGEGWDGLPYSHKNASQTMRALRLVFGAVLLSVSGLCFLALCYLDSDQAVIASSESFQILMAAVAFVLGCTGFVILMAGFWRGLLGALGASVVVTYLGLCYYCVDTLMKTDSIFSIPVLVVSIAVLLVGIWRFMMVATRRRRRFFTTYEQDGCLYAVDLLLADCSPIQGYDRCISFDIRVTPEAELKDYNRFCESLHLYCANRGLIFAGVVLDFDEQLFKVYVYTRFAIFTRLLRRFVAHRSRPPVVMASHVDPDWSIYRAQLAPSDTSMIKLLTYHLMANQAADFDQVTPQWFVISAGFADRSCALGFLEAASRREYSRICLLDNSEFARQNELTDDLVYQVFVQTFIPINEGRLNNELISLNNLAKEHGGCYSDFWMGRLDENDFSADSTIWVIRDN